MESPLRASLLNNSAVDYALKLHIDGYTLDIGILYAIGQLQTLALLQISAALDYNNIHTGIP